MTQEADLSMAKRQRGSTRPGQRPPTKSTTGRQSAATSAAPAPQRPTPQRPTGSLTDDDLARAAALEAGIVEEERQASAALARNRDRRRSAALEVPVRGRSRAVSTLAVVAADEYTYVLRDLRRIVVVFVGIFALLFATFIVMQIAGIGRVA